MNTLHRFCLRTSLGFALFAVIGCDSTSMRDTPAGKSVRVGEIPETSAPQVSPVYLTPY